jgi:hypothetical protein
MNSVIEAQANKLPEFKSTDDTEAHLYLERMQLPVDVQDQVLLAIHNIKPDSLLSIGDVIEQAMESHIAEFLSH